MRFIRRGVLFSLGALACAAPLDAQVMGMTARQMPPGSLKLLMYYQGTQGQDLNFNVSNPAGTCATPNGVTFGCGQGGNVDATGSGGMAVMKLVYQPWENLQYYAAFGVGDYSLSVPSVTVVNTLSGDSPGIMGMAGVRAVLVPDTQFTPAVAADISMSESRYSFDQSYPNIGGPSSISQRLLLMQFQVAFEISHLFTIIEAQKDVEKEHEVLLPQGFKIEPYGGLKWTRIQSDLKDFQTGGHSGGQEDTASPFIGLRLPVYEHESLFAEADFVHGYQYAGGMEIRFK